MSRFVLTPSEFTAYIGRGELNYVDKPFQRWLQDRYPKIHQKMVGHTRSSFSHDGLIKRLERLNDPDRPLIHKNKGEAFQQAIQIVSNRWRTAITAKGKLSPLSHEQITFPTLRSAGPHFPGKNRQQVHEQAKTTAEQIYHGDAEMYSSRRYACCIRTQIAEESDPKIRFVYGQDHAQFCAERYVCEPILQPLKDASLSNNKFPYVYGFTLPQLRNRLQSQMTDLDEEHENLAILEADWSFFDGWIYDDEVKAFFDMIADCYDDERAKQFCRVLGQRWHKPTLVIGNQEVQLAGTAPSGSTFVNTFDSFVNELRWTFLFIKNNLKLDSIRLNLHGDDFLAVSTDRRFSYIDWKNQARIYFPGTKLDPVVLHRTLKTAKFLGHTFGSMKMSREMVESLRLAYYTERENNKDIHMTAVRVKSLFEDGGSRNSVLYTFLNYYCQMKNVKYEDIKVESWWSNLFSL
jgi:hypothetical protein